MAYSRKRQTYGLSGSYRRDDARFLPLLRSMTGVQRQAQDLVNTLQAAGAGGFTDEEKEHLRGALYDIARRIRASADNI